MNALERRLDERLVLLQDSGQVDTDIAAFLREALDELADSLGLQATDQRLGNLCTHLALAFQRARNEEGIDSWDTDHSEELADHGRYVAAAAGFADRAEAALNLELPMQERQFIAMHLAAASVRGD